MLQSYPRFFVPEVVQTSEMDCGPAALKCLLEGFGIPASYGRLREACQTDVDGASLDTLEEVANQLGLHAEQIVLPADHLFLSVVDALPALVVVKQPNGAPHFVVVWNMLGPWVQIMDPAIGRRWVGRQQFLRQVYHHTTQVDATEWRLWAESDAFCEPLRQRLLSIGIDEFVSTQWLEQARQLTGWRTLSTLDAATRMVDTLVRTGGIQRGKDAQSLLSELFALAWQPQAPPLQRNHNIALLDRFIPEMFWFARYAPPSESFDEQLSLRGAVFVRVLGRNDDAEAQITPGSTTTDNTATPARPLPPDLAAALSETPTHPILYMLNLLRADGLITPLLLLCGLLLATVGTVAEALLLRGLLVVSQHFAVVGARLQVLLAVILFALLLLLLELPITSTLLHLGRRVETRLRILFLEKIPRLSDHYFHSRLTSDMAQRAHELRQLRTLPELAVQFLRLLLQLILTAAGILWLAPGNLLLVLSAVLLTVALALFFQPILTARDLRMRAHNSTLARFYLDALLGLVPIRTHSAARAIRREQERMLVAWVRAYWSMAQLQIVIESAAALLCAGFVIWIVTRYLATTPESGNLLLLLYWVLNLPVLGQALLKITKQYPLHHNRILKLLEPLGAPEEDDQMTRRQDGKMTLAELPTPLSPPHAVIHSSTHPVTPSSSGVAITLQDVIVHAGGHTILDGINLRIAAGEHVAIVGPSGAGKSSLVGLLLGWHRPAAGQVLVDGQALIGEELVRLRRATAWVDPSVQLWNRSLVENLRYGVDGVDLLSVGRVVEAADLLQLLEKLPDGLQTDLGEGGGFVSGGEGQRVRLGRALLRPGVRLVILDEPFRGLARSKRQELLALARQHWRDCTLLCITHDVQETQHFDRVVVVAEGAVVEDGAPSHLLAQPASRYQTLLQAETAVREELWGKVPWRRLWLEQGRLREGA